jgi:hypothetical protein
LLPSGRDRRLVAVNFWDLSKLLARRWMIALPMVALSTVLTVLAVGHANPDYIATAYIQVVPPVAAPATPGQATPDMRNPWLRQGLQSIVSAAIVQVLDQTVVEQLKAQQDSDSYTVEVGGSTPMVSFEVVGNSERQAKDTADLLVHRFTDSVTSLQSAFGVTKADMITSRRLDAGTNVKISGSKVKRALISAALAGFLATAGVTVGVDARVRRRQQRKAEIADPAAGGGA